MVEEMVSLQSNGTWDLVTLPLGKSPAGFRWVYIVKVCPNSQVDYLKVQLVAKRYTHIHGSDYYDIFFPIAKITDVLLLLNKVFGN